MGDDMRVNGVREMDQASIMTMRRESDLSGVWGFQILFGRTFGQELLVRTC